MERSVRSYKVVHVFGEAVVLLELMRRQGWQCRLRLGLWLCGWCGGCGCLRCLGDIACAPAAAPAPALRPLVARVRRGRGCGGRHVGEPAAGLASRLLWSWSAVCCGMPIAVSARAGKRPQGGGGGRFRSGCDSQQESGWEEEGADGRQGRKHVTDRGRSRENRGPGKNL